MSLVFMHTNGYANTTLCLHQSIEGKVIYNKYREDYEILKMLCDWKGRNSEGHLMPGHIHMLVSIPA